MPLARTPLKPSRLDKNTDQSSSADTTTANMQQTNVAKDSQQTVDVATNITTPQAQQGVELVTTHTVPIVTVQQDVGIEPTAQDNPTSFNVQVSEKPAAATGAIAKKPQIIETGAISKNSNSKTVEVTIASTENISKKSNDNPVLESGKNIQGGTEMGAVGGTEGGNDDTFDDLEMDGKKTF